MDRPIEQGEANAIERSVRFVALRREVLLIFVIVAPAAAACPIRRNGSRSSSS
jgi:hypothetical protein